MPEGEVMIADLGLVVGAARPGDGEGEPLSKGLLRHRALPGTVVDMLPISFCKYSRLKAGKQFARKGKHDATSMESHLAQYPCST